jgi:hypothetical protein
MAGSVSRVATLRAALVACMLLGADCLVVGERCTKSHCGGDGIRISIGIAMPEAVAREMVFRLQLCRNGVCEPPVDGLRVFGLGMGTSEGNLGIGFDNKGLCDGTLPVSSGLCAGAWITTEVPHVEGDLYRLIVINSGTGEVLADVEEPAHFTIEVAGNTCNNANNVSCRRAEIRAAVY